MSDTLDRAELSLQYAQALLGQFSADRPTAAEVIGPMPALAVVTDGRAWVAVSQRLADLLGKSPAELLGIAWQDLVHPEDVAASVRAAEGLLRSDGTEGEHENRYRFPGGYARLRWRWARASPDRPWVIALAEIVRLE